MWAVYETSTGELKSTGTAEPTGLPAGLSKKEFVQHTTRPEGFDWNTSTLDWDIPHPVSNVVNVDDLYRELTKAERKAIQTATKNNADVQDFLNTLIAMRRVDMFEPLIQDALDDLESAGLITAQRRAELEGL